MPYPNIGPPRQLRLAPPNNAMTSERLMRIPLRGLAPYFNSQTTHAGAPRYGRVLTAGKMTAGGTPATIRKGQSQSALPLWFRRRPVRLWRVRDIAA